MTATRRAHLMRALHEHRREIRGDVRNRIRDGRSDRLKDVGDELERSDADLQGDIELALLQMRTETLSRIDAALGRLDAGDYGICVECSNEIAEPRLRALPFAVRCQPCEGRREASRSRGPQGASLPLFADLSGSP
jgi:DnaK suppressor protein